MNENNSNQKSSDKSRINAWISPKNYQAINNIMENNKLGTMTLSKGLILDIALANLIHSLEIGETIETLAIQFLEGEAL